MVNRKRKYESGAAVAFMSRNKALRKLQLSLSDFRRLCILKGIYPQEPRHPKKAGKGSTLPKTYYFTKDIQFLLHEPLVSKIREYKVFVRRLKKAIDKREAYDEQRIRKNKPKESLDHIVKERYPTLIDAIRDLDDSLSLCFLFATIPKSNKVHVEQTQLCRKLTIEFLNYVIASKSLRKVFISIKGFYFQAEIMGQNVLWITPHHVAYSHPVDIDYKIMTSFAEFSCIMMGFINFALYKSIELQYPPQACLDKFNDSENCTSKEDLCNQILSSLNETFQFADTINNADKFEITNDVELAKQKCELEDIEKLQNLFKGLRFFLNREVNREVFTFLIRSCSGDVSWDKSIHPYSVEYDETDSSITHHVIDRPTVKNALLTRYYVQPQWIADCINARKLLAVKDYFPGSILPPHLSPFVVEQDGDYVPMMRRLAETDIEEDIASTKIKKMNDDFAVKTVNKNEDDDNADNNDDAIVERKKNDFVKKMESPKKSDANKTKLITMGKREKVNEAKENERIKIEEKKLAEMAMHKKNKRLYRKIVHLNKKKKYEAQVLEDKRKKIKKKKVPTATLR